MGDLFNIVTVVNGYKYKRTQIVEDENLDGSYSYCWYIYIEPGDITISFGNIAIEGQTVSPQSGQTSVTVKYGSTLSFSYTGFQINMEKSDGTSVKLYDLSAETMKKYYLSGKVTIKIDFNMITTTSYTVTKNSTFNYTVNLVLNKKTYNVNGQ